MENNNIVYVETHITNINSVISDIALIYGVSPATVITNKWFKEYSAFVYDSQTANLLFYKSRFSGNWEMDKNILQYKK